MELRKLWSEFVRLAEREASLAQPLNQPQHVYRPTSRLHVQGRQRSHRRILLSRCRGVDRYPICDDVDLADVGYLTEEDVATDPSRAPRRRRERRSLLNCSGRE